MSVVYIGFGSNIQPEHNVTNAIRLLSGVVDVVAISTVYLTKPVGASDSPQFYNGVIKIQTDITPRELKFSVLREIEKTLKRERTQDKYAPRTVDLDIIVYEDRVICEPDLVIPDPDIYERVFIAVPLLELNPDLILPDSGKRLADVANSLNVDSMTPLVEFTAALRKEIVNEH